MMQILKLLLTSCTKELLKLLTTAVDAVKEFFSYKNNEKKTETIKEETKQKEKFDKKVDDIVDKGTLEDLLDLRK